MRNDSRFLPLLRRALLPLVVLGAAACTDDSPLRPGDDDDGNRPVPGSRALGMMEITISGIGTPTMSASALPVRPGALLASGASFALTPVEQGGETGIQLEPYSSGSFTHGERGKGGVRYVYATYRVRNASADSTPYTTPRENLTFLAASTNKTLGETAVSQLRRFDGVALDALAATGIQPTGAAMEGPAGEVVSRMPDVLQVLTEAELAPLQALAPAGVELFPYGFVVRHAASTATRTLAPGPAPGDVEGVVTFAFKLPLQASAAEDPFTVSAIFLAVDDDETRVTPSLEEQSPAGESAFLARAQALGATMKTVLPSGCSLLGDPKDTRMVCPVRTAGPSAGPVATMVDVVVLRSPASTADWPLWAGGRIASDAGFEVRDSSGTVLQKVPLQTSIVGTIGVLEVGNHGLLRMVPRRDRASTTVTATACGHTSAPVALRTSGYSPLVAGAFHSLALKADGSVVAWGNNDQGQTNVPPGLKDVVQVAGNSYHSLALRADGTVVAWGYNTNGQADVPPGLSDVVQVSAGHEYSLALKADGTVVAWGLGSQTAVPTGLTDVVQVAAGVYHSLALKADGTLVAWGSNGDGQTSVPAGLVDVVQVAAGYVHSLALKADGTVVAWGNNTDGQVTVPDPLVVTVP
jgi:hypothetical protein